VHGTETKRIGDLDLRERKREDAVTRHSDRPLSIVLLVYQVSCAGIRIASSQTCEPFPRNRSVDQGLPLATSPAATGSLPTVNTIGIDAVACSKLQLQIGVQAQ
jgi:hypothetical protein